MPKLKTHKGASKRFKITANGKIKRNRAYGSHLLTKKSAKRKRRLKTPTVVFSGDLSKFKRLLPYG